MKKILAWKVLFSQSGSEIYDISKKVGRFPDSIITNKPLSDLEKINPKLVDEAFEKFIFIPRKPTVEEYCVAIKPADLVTLHGYLRILPPEICFKFNIYNGHPGLINKYPELKGFNPQKRVWDSPDGYSEHGHVIHKVISEVDEGKITSSRSFSSDQIHKDYVTFDNYCNEHRSVAINNWVAFMSTRL